MDSSMRNSEAVPRAVQIARDAFVSQQSVSETQKGPDALRRLSRAVREHENEIVSALQADFGKPELESLASELSVFYQEVRELKRCLKRFFRPQRRPTPQAFFRSTSTVYREPFGTVLVIAPWNYPFQLSVVPVAGALAAGNSVVLKPSELASNVAGVLEKILHSAFPEGLARVVQGDKQVVQELLSHRFDHIFYTGNSVVGKTIMKSAAEQLTPVTLELGGKNPAVVTAKADMRVAAQRIAWGKAFNAGQTCVAPDYVLVDGAVHDEFVGELRAAFVRMYGEKPLNSADMARIINDRHFNRLKALLDGTQGVIWGGSCDPRTRAISPAVVTDLSWDDQLMKEEIFGPLLPILRYQSRRELVERVNSRSRPLAVYVFSTSNTEARQLFADLPSGGGCINDVVLQVASSSLPFGGVGESGFGRYRGLYSLRAFTYERALVNHRIWPELRLRYPPYEGKLRLMRWLLGS